MPNGGVPFYFKVDSVKVKDNLDQYMAHNVSDIWIEANTDNVGAFGLPCKAPVLQQGPVRFVLSAGVKESGQSGIRVIYPFYTSDTFTLNANTDTIYTRTPEFKYIEGALFSVNEDFNFTDRFQNHDLFSLGNNNRCATISVNSVDSNKVMLQIDSVDLPEGQEIWLEFDYKGDVPCYTGFYGLDANATLVQAPVLFLNAKADWNHSYVKLSNYIGQVRAPFYKIYFEALRPYGTPSGTVYIDNVKLVHF